MRAIAAALVALVVLLHIAFGIMEMFYWQHPAIMERFGSTAAFAKASAVLAANQGLYNMLFAAALLWALVTANRSMMLVLLACIVVDGFYGGMTAKATIIFVQAVPAALAFIAAWIARPAS